jgi:uncharacterized UPF0160 family protein
MITIATHSGSFHADDVFGCAILCGCLQNSAYQVVRTRDPEVIAAATYAVDVGGIWDAAAGRFDHHQKGFDGARSSGVTYASAGLVWAQHGEQYLQMLDLRMTNAEARLIAQLVDDELVQYLDMADTGAASNAPGFFGLSALISSFNLTGLEERAFRAQADGAQLATESRLDAFTVAMKLVDQLLYNIVREKLDQLRGADRVRGSELSHDGRILTMDVPGLSWFEVVCKEMPDVQFVLYPDSTDQQWQVRTVPVVPHSFDARRDLPRAWAGLRDQALADATGVDDAVFCHNGVFIAGAKSKEGALKLAALAVADGS